jgi:hypothetical protein
MRIKWHPLLQEPEARRPADTWALEHEQQCKHEPAAREALNRLGEALMAYANVLAVVAAIRPLTWPEPTR